MSYPNIPCKISIHCPIYPSEDADKVQKAIKNIFETAPIKVLNDSLVASVNDIEFLSRIYNVIQSKHNQRTYRKQLKRNQDDDSTWFYLNKQAAFVNTIALCEDYEESPLGPIKITLRSKRIDDVIEWLTT